MKLRLNLGKPKEHTPQAQDDQPQYTHLELLLYGGWNLRKDQPKELQTGAGILKLRAVEHTRTVNINVSNEIKIHWSGKETKYLVYIIPQGIATEEFTGYVGLTHLKAGDIFDSTKKETSWLPFKLGEELEHKGIMPEEKVVEEDPFYPIGAEGTETYLKYKHKGIGMTMLRVIEGDTLVDGTTVLFCYTGHGDTLGKRLLESGYKKFDYDGYMKILARK